MKSDDSLNPTPTDFPDPAAEPITPTEPIDPPPEDIDPDAEDRPGPREEGEGGE